DCPFALVWHMTVGARYAAAGMNALVPELELGMLGFEDRSAGFRVGVVGEFFVVVIALDLFDAQPVVPGVGDGLLLAFEIIFDVTLAADVAPHFLPRGQGIDVVFA